MSRLTKQWMPDDRFYKGYSFAVHFGYSSNDEYRKISKILASSNIPSTNENVKLAMDCVKSMAIEIKKIGNPELEKMRRRSVKDQLVGSVVPFDVSTATEVLRFLLEYLVIPAAMAGAERVGEYIYHRIKKKTRAEDNDTTKYMNEQLAKVIEKINLDDKSTEVISQYEEEFSLKLGKHQLISAKEKKKLSVKKSTKDDDQKGE